MASGTTVTTQERFASAIAFADRAIGIAVFHVKQESEGRPPLQPEYYIYCKLLFYNELYIVLREFTRRSASDAPPRE